MRKRWYWLAGIVWGVSCIMSPVWAQEIESPVLYILEEEDHPVEGATLNWKGKLKTDAQRLYSDSLGRIFLPVGWEMRRQLVIFKPGYQTVIRSPSSLREADFHVYLQTQIYDVEEVVFTANKFREKRTDIPHQIAVVTRPQIELGNPQTSADLLQQQGGVFVQRSQAGGGSPNLRGFEANKVLLVIDGVRMNNAIYRSGHLQNVITIDPAVIDRAEVLFGPGSVIYGSDALGGVMHLYTRKPQLRTSEAPLASGQAALRGSSANGELNAHINLNLAGKRWAALSSLTLSRFGDLRMGAWRPSYPEFGLRDSLVQRINGQDSIVANPSPHLQGPSGYKQIDWMQKILFAPKSGIAHTLNLQFSNSTDVPRYDRLTQMRDDRLRYAEWYYGPQTRGLASYQLVHETPQRWYDQLTFSSAYQYIQESRHNRTLDSDWLGNRRERVHALNTNLDARLERPKGHEWAYGVEHTQNWVTSQAEEINILTEASQPLDTRYPDGGTYMATAAAYLTHRWEPSPRMTLTSGIRYTYTHLLARFEDKSFFPFAFDEIRQDNQALSGNLGWVWKLPSEWRISALGSTGFRAPNLDDVAKVFDSQPGTVVVPNPDLRPEYTYNAELSVRKSWSKQGHISATGFFTWYDHAIVLRPALFNGQSVIEYDGVASEVISNVNARQAYLTGFNVQANWRWGYWQVYKQLSLTYGNALDEDSLVPMDHIPPLFGKGGLRFMGKKWQTDFFIAYQAAKSINRYSPRDLNNLFFATEDGSPAWWTLNLKGSMQLRPQIRIQAGIENILDLHYRPYSSRISAPGRNVYLALRTDF